MSASTSLDKSGAACADSRSTKFGPYTEHPVAALFPLMCDTDQAGYADLIDGIREQGLIEPIVLDGSMIIDGRNRYLACTEAKVAPHFVQYADMGMDMPTYEFAFQRNFIRRQMTPDQRAAVLAGYLAFDEDSVKAQQAEGGRKAGRGRPQQVVTDSSQPIAKPKRAPTTRKKLAERAQVSEHKAQLALNVQVRGTDELKTAVRNGKTTLAKAQDELPPRVELSNAGAQAGQKEIRAQARETPTRKAGKRKKREDPAIVALQALQAFAEFCEKDGVPEDTALAIYAEDMANVQFFVNRIYTWLDKFSKRLRQEGEGPRKPEDAP